MWVRKLNWVNFIQLYNLIELTMGRGALWCRWRRCPQPRPCWSVWMRNRVIPSTLSMTIGLNKFWRSAPNRTVLFWNISSSVIILCVCIDVKITSTPGSACWVVISRKRMQWKPNYSSRNGNMTPPLNPFSSTIPSTRRRKKWGARWSDSWGRRKSTCRWAQRW